MSDDTSRFIDGEQRLKHGYTNATSTNGRKVIKRYVGPDKAERQTCEASALKALHAKFPVPPLIEENDGSIIVGWMPGIHGQELLEERPEDVLFSVGQMGRRLHQIELNMPYASTLSEDGRTLVHGDFGPQNMLFDPKMGYVSAVLDWEMSHVGDPVEDIAWAEWIVRFHHGHLIWALPALFEGYVSRPSWSHRKELMLAKCEWALNFVSRWRLDDQAGVSLWQERIVKTMAFSE